MEVSTHSVEQPNTRHGSFDGEIEGKLVGDPLGGDVAVGVARVCF